MLQIIMAIEDEDDRSFVESLYNKYKGKMKQIAYDILQNEHDAQDCVHETIVIIIEKLERFKGTTDEESLKWLISVVCKNKAIDKYRKNKRQNMHQYSLTRYDLEEDEYIVDDIPDFQYNAEKIVISEEGYRCLITLVNQLEEKYRDPILLKYRGWDNRDISDFLCISEELVRKRQQRAKEKICELGGNILYAEYQKR